MNVSQLVEKYIDRIVIEYADYVPVNDAEHDAAEILMNIPTAMLNEYITLKGQDRELPDGAEFWKETGLVTRLRNSKKCPINERQPLNDILTYLGGGVWGNYQKLNIPERIRLRITEIPKPMCYPISRINFA